MKIQRPVYRPAWLVLAALLLLPAGAGADSEPSPPRTRPWLGVLMQPVTPPLAEAFGLVEANGVLVGEVKPGSPADKGGLKQGDVIVRFDTHYIRSLDDLPKAIHITPTGKTVEVQVIRDRKTKTLNVTLAALPDPVREKPLASFDKALGMEIREITRRVAQRLKLQDATGVMISEITPGKPAAEAGLRRGDIIAEVNKKPVASLDDYLRLTAGLGKEVMLFLVKRGKNTLFIGVRRS